MTKIILLVIFIFFSFSGIVFSDNHKTNFKYIKGYKEQFLSKNPYFLDELVIYLDEVPFVGLYTIKKIK